MAKLSILAGSTGKLMDVFIQDSSSTTGAGLTGLTNASGSLTWYYYREGAGASVQVTSIATMTLGTWATKGFIVIDGTNMPGCYQLGVPDAALAAGAKSVIMMLKGAANMVPLLIEIELTAVDNQNATSFGLSDLDATVSSRMATYSQPTGFLAATFPSGTVANTTNITAGTITTVTNLTNAPTAGDLTATMKTSVATAVWTDTTASDFTTALSVGKSVMNGVTLGTGLTVASVSGSVGSVTGLTASNLDTTVSSRMATYSQPTGFLAATFPSGTIANTTNITAGTMTTTTNLTNLPSIPNNWLTAAGIAANALNGKGDWELSSSYPTNFSALAISVGGAVTVGTITDKTGYSLTAAYDPAKTAAQAGDAMTLTSAYDFAKGTTAMTESYAANGVAPSPVQALYAIQQYLMDFSISSTNYTVKKLNNSTTAYVVTLNDATSPTAAART